MGKGDDRSGAIPRTVYVVGGGVAGVLAAAAIARRSRDQVVILERAETLAAGLTQGNGRSLTVTEGTIAAGLSAEQVAAALGRSVAAGGYGYPGFRATAAERGQMADFAARSRQRLTDPAAVAARDRALLRFGVTSLHLWRRFAAARPLLAARTGLQLHPKLRLYGGDRGLERAEGEAQAVAAALDAVAPLDNSCPGGAMGGSTVPAAIAARMEPSLAAHLGTFAGGISVQPGGAIHGARLVEELAAALVAEGAVTVQTGATVRSLRWRGDAIAAIEGDWRSRGQVWGGPSDAYVFATGIDPLLSACGALAEPLFPLAGTSITLPVSGAIARLGIPFCRRSWKDDGLGPLVISSVFLPDDAYFDFLDSYDFRRFRPDDPALQRTELIDRTWGDRLDLARFDPACLDPRCVERFDPRAVGPAAGRWEIRIGGLKFYPGDRDPADLNHPGSRWAIATQIQFARAVFPDLMAQLIDPAIDPAIAPPDALAPLQPWGGSRPVYASGMAALGPFCGNGYAIVGTGSWGLTSGLANAEAIAQWIDGTPTDAITLPGLARSHWRDYRDRVRPPVAIPR
ncbi:MAG: FAD-dependent oxidoreductase [Cyanobacteria bacterium]|nr:FAD-dependent oxidoreductase [Cyanobacteriota bacterium]